MKILTSLSVLALFSVLNFSTYAKAESTLPSEVSFEEYSDRLAGRQVDVKNYSNRQVCVAIIEAEPLKARGWYIINNGESKSFYNIAYIHAEECGQTGVLWNPKWDLQYFCTHPTNAFDYYTPDNSTMCKDLGGTMKEYYHVPAGSGVYTWTLNY